MGETDYPTAADWAASAAHGAQASADAVARDVADLRRRLSPAPERPGGQYADIENRFSYHPAATPLRQAQHEAVRDACKRLAHAIDRIVPPGRAKDLALTAVEESMHWANAAVACQVEPNPAPEPPQPPDGEPIHACRDYPACEAQGAHSVWADDEPETLHVLPTPPDAIEHETGNGPACPCGPRLEPQPGGGLIIVHNAADGRL